MRRPGALDDRGGGVARYARIWKKKMLGAELEDDDEIAIQI
jgi:hypothetical protein